MHIKKPSPQKKERKKQEKKEKYRHITNQPTHHTMHHLFRKVCKKGSHFLTGFSCKILTWFFCLKRAS